MTYKYQINKGYRFLITEDQKILFILNENDINESAFLYKGPGIAYLDEVITDNTHFEDKDFQIPSTDSQYLDLLKELHNHKIVSFLNHEKNFQLKSQHLQEKNFLDLTEEEFEALAFCSQECMGGVLYEVCISGDGGPIGSC